MAECECVWQQAASPHCLLHVEQLGMQYHQGPGLTSAAGQSHPAPVVGIVTAESAERQG